MIKLRIKLLLKLLITLITIYAFVCYVIVEKLLSSRSKGHSESKDVRALNLSQVIVHLDLKGAPPRLGYLTSLLPKLRENGATGLLVEYEDMFPYEGRLANLSARNCYGKDELSQFIQTASSLGLELVPLLQTFGHLESALKLEEFRQLRERPAFPDSLCPSRAGSRALVSEMLAQVMEFHTRLHPVKFVHIGCDEVFHINSCAACRRRNLGNEDIFLQQVIVTSADIKRKYPEVTVLIWDDMLRGISPVSLKKCDLRAYVEPVVWDYKPQVDTTHLTFFKYYNNFNNIWIASAFKGAERKATTLTDISRRFMNHFGWMNKISDYKMAGTKDVFGFRGIFITGWSRFSHFDPLCELLPGSLPSLMLGLLTVQEFVTNVRFKFDDERYVRYKVIDKFSLKLNCTHKVVLDEKNIHNNCKFDEMELYGSLVQLDTLMTSLLYEERRLHFINGDVLDFYVRNNHINMNELIKIRTLFQQYEIEFILLSNKLRRQLKVYFDNHVIEEYVSYKVLYIMDIVEKVLGTVKKMENLKTWKPGPIT